MTSAARPRMPAAPAAAEPQRGAEVAVVIVSYRCRDDVLRCVGSVTDTVPDQRYEVVVVDNDSRDGTPEALRANGGVTVIETGENAGFARAANIGIAATRAPYVLLLNPDAVVEPGALDTLVAFAGSHERAGVVAPRLVHPGGADQLTARAFPTPAAALFGRRSPLTRAFPRNPWSRRFLVGATHAGDEPFRVGWVSGACMLVPRTCIDRVGPLDEGFFLFWEDADWCRRITDAGFEVWCVPKARVVHDEGGSRGHGWPVAAIRSFHRGAYRYWCKHHAPQPWNPARWVAAVGLAARAAAVVAIESQRTRHRARARDQKPPRDPRPTRPRRLAARGQRKVSL